MKKQSGLHKKMVGTCFRMNHLAVDFFFGRHLSSTFQGHHFWPFVWYSKTDGVLEHKDLIVN